MMDRKIIFNGWEMKGSVCSVLALGMVLLLTGCEENQTSKVERPVSEIQQPEQQTTINQQPQPLVAPPPPAVIDLPKPPSRPNLPGGVQ